MSKILVTETIHRDGEYPICFDCQNTITGIQIKCNCGCDEYWCQPCYYKHYRDFAVDITLKRFKDSESEINEEFSEALNQR